MFPEFIDAVTDGGRFGISLEPITTELPDLESWR
jgi:hypothetical protein